MSNKMVGIGAIIIFLLVIVGGVLLVVSRSKSTTSTPKTTTTISKEPVTLTVWQAFDDDTAFKQTIDAYVSVHPNVKIVYVKKDLADYEVQLLNALAAGTGPDIASINNQWLPRHVDKLIPLQENYFKASAKNETRSNAQFYKAAFVPIVTGDNVIDDKVYGMPLYLDTLAIYSNTKLWGLAQTDYRKANSDNPNFDDALFRHPPATWNDLLKELPWLTKKDVSGAITQGGIGLGTSNNVPFSADILSLFMLQNNTKMVDVGQKLARFNTFQNDAGGNPIYTGTNALDFYTSFARSDKANYSWDTAMPDALQAFIDGKLALFVGYQYITQTLKQRAPTLEYSVLPMPQVKDGTKVNYGSYWTEAVTNNSKHAAAAWDLVVFMASHPQNYLRATGRTLAIVTPDVPEDVFSKQATSAADWYKGKQAEKMDSILNEMIDNVTAKHQPLQASIDNASSAVSDLLQKE